MKGFNLFNKDKKPEDDIETTFQITGQMTLEELPEPIADQFYTLCKNIENINTEMNKGKSAQQDPNSEENEKNLLKITKEINHIAENKLFYDIISLGHQIDSGKKTLKEYQGKLEEAKQDLKSFDGIKSFPTPFFIRYSNQLENLADSISEEITSYASHLQSLSSNSKNYKNLQNNVIIAFLQEEHDAILRESTRIARLNKKLSETRRTLCQKLNIQHSEISNPGEDVTDSLAKSVERKYFQFRESQKSKILRNQLDANLFGQPTTIIAEAPKTGTFAAKSNLNFASSSFGKGKTSGEPPKAPTAADSNKSPFKK